MDVLAVAVALTVIAVAFVLYPVLAGESAPLTDEGEGPSEAELRKRTTLEALRDAEYDRLSGKLDERDFQSLRAQLVAEAAEALGAEAEGAEAGGGASYGEAEEVEREIARFRVAIRGGVVCSRCACANEPGSRFCMLCGAALEALRCGACGQTLESSPKFCPACGARAP